MFKRYMIVTALVVAVTGCVSVSSTATPGPLGRVTKPASTVLPLTPTPAEEESGTEPLSRPTTVAEAAVVTAKADLAERLKVASTEIQVISRTQQEMHIQNLGCPTPGLKTDKSLPAFVIGTEIVLRYDNDSYVYHARGRQVIFCGQR
jgi:hypothetical protein